MNINSLSFAIAFKNKIEYMKEVFNSYIYSFKVLNKSIVNYEKINIINNNFEQSIIDDTNYFIEKYKDIPTIGTFFNNKLFLGLLTIENNICLIFIEYDKKITITEKLFNDFKLKEDSYVE